MLEALADALQHFPKIVYGSVQIFHDLHQVVQQPDGETANRQEDNGNDNVEHVSSRHRRIVYHTRIALVGDGWAGYTRRMADQLSDLGLKLNYWFLTNRQQLRKWWVIVLMALDVFLLALLLTQALLLVFRFRDSSNVVATVASSTAAVGQASAKVAPAPIVIGPVATTPHGQSRYDFSARLENVNTTWSAVVTAQFTGGAKPLTPVRVILPPKSVRYAMALNVEGPSSSATAQGAMQITDVTWTRLTPAEAAEDIDVQVTNIATGLQTLVTGENQQRTVTQVTGTVVNRSFVALDGLRIAVVLTRSGATVGVGSTILSTLAAEQSLPFSVEWDTVIANIEKADVYPEVHRGIVVR